MAPSKIDQKKFAREIANLREIEGEMTIMEAIVRYAELKGVDVTNVTKYINQSLKNRIAAEARDLNLLKTKRRK